MLIKNVGQSVDPTKSLVPMEQKSVQDIWRPGDQIILSEIFSVAVECSGLIKINTLMLGKTRYKGI